MHIAEGFLPPAHAVGWTVAAAPFVVHGARAVVREVRERPESTLLLGAVGAFAFVLSAIKLPTVTGSSSHPTGTGAGAVLFRARRRQEGLAGRGLEDGVRVLPSSRLFLVAA